MNKTILGIDLGGCMSGNSAYVLARYENEKIVVTEHFKEPKHKDHLECEKYLIETLNRLRPDMICIDAPLSLPRVLIDPAFIPKQRVGKGEVLNPFLFRDTDYFLYKEFGLKPMPPAGDRIGRLTARAVSLLRQLKYDGSALEIEGKYVPIYEVYPKQIAHHLDLLPYKDTPEKTLSALGLTLEDYDEHVIDALLCVYAGSKILKGDFIGTDKETKKEGWCYPII